MPKGGLKTSFTVAEVFWRGIVLYLCHFITSSKFKRNPSTLWLNISLFFHLQSWQIIEAIEKKQRKHLSHFLISVLCLKIDFCIELKGISKLIITFKTYLLVVVFILVFIFCCIYMHCLLR